VKKKKEEENKKKKKEEEKEYLYGKMFGWKIFEPKHFPYKYSNIFKPSHSLYLTAYEDGIDRVFRNVGI
jgi:hypothetical protein